MSSLANFSKVYKQISREHELDQAIEALAAAERSGAFSWELSADERTEYIKRFMVGPYPLHPDDESELLAWLDQRWDEIWTLHDVEFARLHGGKGGE